MMRIDVKSNGREYTFRTNNSGDYLFIGVHENHQISFEGGFNSLKRIKKAIREYLGKKECPRLSYFPSPYADWKK